MHTITNHLTVSTHETRARARTHTHTLVQRDVHPLGARLASRAGIELPLAVLSSGRSMVQCTAIIQLCKQIIPLHHQPERPEQQKYDEHLDEYVVTVGSIPAEVLVSFSSSRALAFPPRTYMYA